MMNICKALLWMPRMMGVVFALFLALFSLDVFGGDCGFWGTVLAFLMHNIPSMALLAVTIAAWKHELVGAAGFVLFGLLYVGFSVARGHPEWSLIIAGPAFLIGILFLTNWLRKKRA